MANNRLYIRDARTGERLLFCKSMGDGWYVASTFDEIHLNEWMEGRDINASYGNGPGRTELVLETECE